MGVGEDEELCSKCGNRFMGDSAFCRKCGAKRPGSHVEELVDEFCRDCDAIVPPSPLVNAVQDALAAFASQVLPLVADVKLEESEELRRLRLENERLQELLQQPVTPAPQLEQYQGPHSPSSAKSPEAPPPEAPPPMLVATSPRTEPPWRELSVSLHVP